MYFSSTTFLERDVVKLGSCSLEPPEREPFFPTSFAAPFDVSNVGTRRAFAELHCTYRLKDTEGRVG